MAFKLCAGVLAAVLLLGCGSVGADPAAPASFVVGVFEGPGAWPLIVAQRQGFFSEQGISARLVTVSDAREMYDGVASGELNGVVTAFDNLLARDAAGSVGTLDVKAIASYVEGGLAVVGKDVGPGQATRFGVDHPDSGFALYGRDWIARTGRASVSFVEVGGTAERLAALRAGSIDATVLHPPFIETAQAAGFNVLESLDARGIRYQTAVIAVRSDWAGTTGAAPHLISAYCQGAHWLADPANREAAISMLLQAAPETPRPAAERIYGALAKSFSRDGVIHRDAVETVRAMRAARSEAAPPAAEAVIDFQAASRAACGR